MSDKAKDTTYSVTRPGTPDGPSATDLVTVVTRVPEALTMPQDERLKDLQVATQRRLLAKHGISLDWDAATIRVHVHAKLPKPADRRLFEAMAQDAKDKAEFVHGTIQILEALAKR